MQNSKKKLAEKICKDLEKNIISLSRKYGSSDLLEAEDIMQEAFLKVIEVVDRKSNMPYEELIKYCNISVRNRIIDLLRQSISKRRRRNLFSLEEKFIEDKKFMEIDMIVEFETPLSELLKFLPKDERYIMSLYLMGYTQREIETLLQISHSTISKKIKKAREKLVKKL